MGDRIVLGNSAIARRIAMAADVPYDDTRDLVLAHLRNERLTGGVLYTAFTDASCFMHVAGFEPRWGSRDLLWVAFHYPFVQCQLERVFAVVPQINEASLRFVRHLGFREVSRVRDRYRNGRADIVFALDKAACRWLGIRPRTIKEGSHGRVV